MKIYKVRAVLQLQISRLSSFCFQEIIFPNLALVRTRKLLHSPDQHPCCCRQPHSHDTEPVPSAPIDKKQKHSSLGYIYIPLYPLLIHTIYLYSESIESVHGHCGYSYNAIRTKTMAPFSI